MRCHFLDLTIKFFCKIFFLSHPASLSQTKVCVTDIVNCVKFKDFWTHPKLFVFVTSMNEILNMLPTKSVIYLPLNFSILLLICYAYWVFKHMETMNNFFFLRWRSAEYLLIRKYLCISFILEILQRSQLSSFLILFTLSLSLSTL